MQAYWCCISLTLELLNQACHTHLQGTVPLYVISVLKSESMTAFLLFLWILMYLCFPENKIEKLRLVLFYYYVLRIHLWVINSLFRDCHTQAASSIYKKKKNVLRTVCCYLNVHVHTTFFSPPLCAPDAISVSASNRESPPLLHAQECRCRYHILKCDIAWSTELGDAIPQMEPAMWSNVC